MSSARTPAGVGSGRIGRWLAAATAGALVAGVDLAAAAMGPPTTGPGDDSVGLAQAAALVEVAQDRESVVAAIVERWRPTMDGLAYARGWDRELAAALRAASAQTLLAVRQAGTYDEVRDALFGRWRGPAVIALGEGDPIPNVLGSTTGDLVFTPVTPCRIIDTRFATGGFAGRIGPNSGKDFQVNLSDFSAQGGFAGSCGIPTALEVSAVTINVTSTDQTGLGNLRVVETGGGVPNVSLVNYQPGVNVANAAVVRSSVGLGDDIFIYSGNSASHVIVDLLGYFTAPVVTPVGNLVSVSQGVFPAGTNFSLFSPDCGSAWRLTGGGHHTSSFQGAIFSGSRPVQGESTAIILGLPNTADRWLCQGTVGGQSAQTITCFAVCAHVPGRF